MASNSSLNFIISSSIRSIAYAPPQDDERLRFDNPEAEVTIESWLVLCRRLLSTVSLCGLWWLYYAVRELDGWVSGLTSEDARVGSSSDSTLLTSASSSFSSNALSNLCKFVRVFLNAMLSWFISASRLSRMSVNFFLIIVSNGSSSSFKFEAYFSTVLYLSRVIEWVSTRFYSVLVVLKCIGGTVYRWVSAIDCLWSVVYNSSCAFSWIMSFFFLASVKYILHLSSLSSLSLLLMPLRNKVTSVWYSSRCSPPHWKPSSLNDCLLSKV